MFHQFNAAFAACLDNPLRRFLFPAAPLLRRIGLAPGGVFLDIGAVEFKPNGSPFGPPRRERMIVSIFVRNLE